MIKDSENLKRKLKERLDKKADEFIDNLNLTSDIRDFTIDTIEEIMTKFNAESQQMLIDSVNEVLSSFDEKKIIAKKNRK